MSNLSLYFVGLKDPGTAPRLVDGPFLNFIAARDACTVSAAPSVVVEVKIPITTTIISHV